MFGLFKRRKNNVPKLPDPSQDWTSADIVRAVHALAENDSPSNRRDFHDAIAKGALLAVTTGETVDGGENFAVMLNEQGELVLPVFTDIAALVRWESNPPAVLISAPVKLYAQAVEADFAEIRVNPAGFVGGVIVREEFEILARGENVYDKLDPTDAETELSFTDPPFAVTPELRRALADGVGDSLATVYSIGLSVNDGPSRPCLAVVSSDADHAESDCQAIRDLQLVGGDSRIMFVLNATDEELNDLVRQCGEVVYSASEA